MRKLLIGLLGLGCAGVSYGVPSTAQLNISASLASTCITSFTVSGGSTPLTALVAGSVSTGTNTYSIQCTPGVSTLAISATSTNNWRILNSGTVGSGQTNLIGYGITTTTTPPTGFASTWSGTIGNATPVAIVTTTTQPVFTSYDTPVTIPVTITTVAVPATSITGAYSDMVTLTATF